MPLRWLTAGESHGKSLLLIIEGLPAGISIDISLLQQELKRRKKGYGRGKRMEIEEDEVEILSGLRGGKSIGSPISLLIKNRDFENWKEIMDPFSGKGGELTSPRPGHADLAGGFKYGFQDLRNVLERASARETAVRVAAGALAKSFLKEFGIQVISQTLAVGNVFSEKRIFSLRDAEKIESSPLRCLDGGKEVEMMKLIDEAKRKGDTLGGIFEVVAFGVPPGLGSYVQWDKRLDGRLAQALLSIPSVKGVEIGEAVFQASNFGSKAHDEIFFDERKGFYRRTNYCGGLEGGVTNGEKIILKGYVKPIPTLGKPLRSVDIITKREKKASRERADICVVPAAGVVAEAMVSLILADSFLEKFGQDNLDDIKNSYQSYLSRIEWKRET
jgi:chorismate synthase